MDSLLTLLLPTSCLYNLVLWCHSLIIQNNWVITIRSVNENLPAITKNVTTINSLQFPPEWALRGLRMETNGLPAAKPSARAPAPTGIPWGIQNEKERDLSPRQLRPRSKQQFQGAQTLASSQTQKSAKFTNLRCLVSLILMFWSSSYLVFVAKPPTHSGSPLTSLEQSLRAILEAVSGA